jgi:hypothetical protein
VDGVPALRFATAARRLGAAARASGLVVPAFRSPPRVKGATRTLRRYPGGAVVAVRLRDRAYGDVVDDMIDGVLATNRVPTESASRLRRAFKLALGEPDAPAVPEIDLVALEQREAEERTGESVTPPSLSAQARVAERQTQAA